MIRLLTFLELRRTALTIEAVQLKFCIAQLPKRRNSSISGVCLPWLF